MTSGPRAQLLAAAASIAAQISYEELSISRICELAELPASAFKSTFGDIPAYIDAVQQEFLHTIRTRIIQVTDGSARGTLRIKLGSESYLAYCLEQADIRAWLVAARARPVVLHALQQQNRSFTLVLGAELKGMGRQLPEAAAQLYIAMLNEVANSEQRARRRLPELREALWHFLDHVGDPRAQHDAA